VGDPGIVVFGKSMHVSYVNDRARLLFDCARSASPADPRHDDLMFRIVKSVAGVRDRMEGIPRTAAASDPTDDFTVSTRAGPFRILAFPIPRGGVETQLQVMVMIYQCQRVRKVPGVLRSAPPMDRPVSHE
jgi:hypothetical protein